MLGYWGQDMSDMISFRVEDNFMPEMICINCICFQNVGIMSSVNFKFKDICKMWCLAMELSIKTREILQREDKDLQAVMCIN